jgi:hypothetical protein
MLICFVNPLCLLFFDYIFFYYCYSPEPDCWVIEFELIDFSVVCPVPPVYFPFDFEALNIGAAIAKL